MCEWIRALVRDAQAPAARRILRLLLAATGILLAEFGAGVDAVRVAGMICILMSCTFIVAARAGLQADLLERERQLAYDSGRDDQASICEAEHHVARKDDADADTALPAAASSGIGGTLLPFNRPTH